jgi:hypothetical protein
MNELINLFIDRCLGVLPLNMGTSRKVVRKQKMDYHKDIKYGLKIILKYVGIC